MKNKFNGFGGGFQTGFTPKCLIELGEMPDEEKDKFFEQFR